MSAYTNHYKLMTCMIIPHMTFQVVLFANESSDVNLYRFYLIIFKHIMIFVLLGLNYLKNLYLLTYLDLVCH